MTEVSTTAQFAAFFFATTIWGLISFYVHLPVLQNPDKELAEGAELLAFPTITLVVLKKVVKDDLYREGGRR